MKKFEGQVTLVTGAGRGIGKAIASAFAREKAYMIINDVCPQDELNKVVDDLSALGGQSMAIRADVSQSDQVKEMIGQTEKTFHRLDILVNNAGIIRRGTIETVTEEEWDQVMRVNLKGTFNCCKAVVDIMKRQKRGKIVKYLRQSRRYLTITTGFCHVGSFLSTPDPHLGEEPVIFYV